MTLTTDCVNVIIPVYNQPDYVQKMLTSLFSCGDSTSFEVIVIDDCSTDQRVSDLLRDYADRGLIRLIVTKRRP
jgi:O-antigen biosynthesis protein